jgi:hypothetical protein
LQQEPIHPNLTLAPAFSWLHLHEATHTMAVPSVKTLPCLFFETEAEEAARHYVSIFPNSSVSGSSPSPSLPHIAVDQQPCFRST